MKRALVIVDVQNDFCEGGSMPVTGGIDVAARICEYVLDNHDAYEAISATVDWHVDPGDHWSRDPDFTDSWPVHCEVGTPGSQFRPELEPALEHVQAVFRKGEYLAAYSGFEASTEVDGEVIQLAAWLRDRHIEEVDVVGIATDHCVRATALDSAREGFTTRVLLDLTAGVSVETTQIAVDRMRDEGVLIDEGSSRG